MVNKQKQSNSIGFRCTNATRYFEVLITVGVKLARNAHFPLIQSLTNCTHYPSIVCRQLLNVVVQFVGGGHSVRSKHSTGKSLFVSCINIYQMCLLCPQPIAHNHNIRRLSVTVCCYLFYRFYS